MLTRELMVSPGANVLIGLAIAMVAWYLVSRLEENEFSMNSFYRNRLARCYLQPSRVKVEGCR